MTLPWLCLGLFIFVAFTTEAMTGFGSIVIALSLGALLLPIEVILPVLVPLNIIMSGFFSWRYRAEIHWPTLLKLILPLMVAGTLAGYGLRPWLGDQLLKSLFGVLVLWFSSRELWRSWRGLDTHPHGPWAARLWTFLAGITHGLFASGGPLLVYALSGLSLPKTRFRATLILVWFCLNGLLTVVFALDGSLFPALAHLAVLVPVVIVAMVLGEFLHHRVNEARFRQAVFVVLWIAGLALAWPR
ncbi:sulfite exporter TauE/SafE family protein [Alcanivorax hongdengensis]|uniref:sulfite exporter TauE/SafE family protein n=1 Tax=Alcanivorax hongdengensis TaxID=519051 RepID=UPI00058B7184|nr:sulfite exporter TauE/SafE family protein [Alcanivorax hongdengensis]